MTCILMLLAAMVSDDPFVVTDSIPAFVVTERPAVVAETVEPPAVVDSGPVYELVMYTAEWCGPCQSWKRTVLPAVRRAGITPTIIDVDQTRGTGVSRIPEFRVLRKHAGKTEIVQKWTGYVTLASIQSAMRTAPARNPQLFGRTGTSHESRETLIRHLLQDGIHAGKHTPEELRMMSDADLDALHTRDHADAR